MPWYCSESVSYVDKEKSGRTLSLLDGLAQSPCGPEVMLRDNLKAVSNLLVRSRCQMEERKVHSTEKMPLIAI